MLLMYDDLLGHDFANKVVYFSGSDKKILFEENVNKMPNDWYYKTHSIEYKYNSHGHRCVDIKDLDLQNYILFVGDSCVEGIGLELKHTFPYLISKKLNLPYYNLGLGGSGIDYMFYNLSIWLHKFPLPKFICVFWTNLPRYLTNSDGIYIPSGAWSKDIVNQDFLKNGLLLDYFDTKFNLIYKMVSCILIDKNIPYSMITYFDEKSFQNTKIHKINVSQDSTARDLKHPGFLTNQKTADYVVDRYSDKYSNATINSTIRGKSN